MFIERLKALIKEKGITQKTFLTDIGLNKNNIRNWELNNTIPTKPILDAISDYFGVSVDYLLGKTDDREPTQNKKAPTTNVVDEKSEEKLKEILDHFSQLSEEKQDAFLEMFKALLKMNGMDQ